ncbi:MAG: acetylornithine deacetylase [Gemmatimonadales bacterium]|nr:acetylornithine deacetylase [Gemmatimonadales bacterium]
MTALLTDGQLLARLVGFDTTSRNSNLPIADFICDYLDRPGVRIRRNPSPDGEKTNLVVFVGPETDPERRDGLVLSGHMDVVPADPAEWDSDPFRLVERGDAYVARGVCDMKGFLALAINRAAQLGAAALRRPLVLLLSYDEEVGTVGAKHFMQSWSDRSQLPRRTIVGEPTSLTAVRAHKGHLEFRVDFHGTSAHSGYPHLGVNAIEQAGRAIVALGTLRDRWRDERPDTGLHFPDAPYLTLNIGRIAGGTAVNVVPDRCAIALGVRVLPGIDIPAIQDHLARSLGAALDDTPFELRLTSESPALLLDQRAEIYQAVCEEGQGSGADSVSYATDAGWLQHAGLECVVFGPGSIAVAHTPNESLPIREFIAASGILDRLVHRFCRTEH